jgi:uncharacterized OB-fold protein
MEDSGGSPGLQPGVGQVRKAGHPGLESGEGRKGKPDGNLAGTALKEEDLKKKDLLKEEWNEVGLSYTWSTGVAIGTYLEGLKKGRLLGVRCRSCNRTMVPPRLFCEECFRTVDEFVPVADTGTINTFAICYIRTDASRQKKPQMPAVVELDGATKGMGILHLLGEVKPENVKIGMKVRAVWKPARERKGDITDIRYFKPYEPLPAAPAAAKRAAGPKAAKGKAKLAAKPKAKPKPKRKGA